MSIWVIGSGAMAGEYIKVLKDLGVSFKVIGRSEKSATLCRKEHNCDVTAGGLEKYLSLEPSICSHAIVSVGVDQLAIVTNRLLDVGIKNILTEKPAGLTKEEIKELERKADLKKANVIVAYNRRFFASVLEAKNIIEKDEGVTSFNFEFTEWSHIIEKLDESLEIKEKYVLANSTHVIDLAFYLGGKPRDINSFTSNSLSWHESSSIFCGAGVSDNGALFNYQANWESAGRWSVEMLTKNNRLILRPMEKLMIQKRGTISQDLVEDIDYSLDEKYKPGLFIQTQKFINDNYKDMCLLKEQSEMVDIYYKMANYK